MYRAGRDDHQRPRPRRGHALHAGRQSGEGRRELLSHYDHRVQREFYSETVGHRTTLRQQLQNAAVRFKLALTQPELLAPFRLN